MTCVHLRELYQLVERHDLKLSSSDLIRVTCLQCGVQETCPSKVMDDDEAVGDAEGRAANGGGPNPVG